MPPPSSGGITVALIANILESYDLRAMGWHSPDALHVTAEAMRRAFADRNHYLGDPDVVEMPVAMLLSKSYAAGRSASISMDRATPSREVLPGHAGESMHTTHFSVVDGKGNAVAMTTTINLGFGSAVTVTGAGFLLNDEMDDFATKPGSPNAFGLVQGEANAIAPGKRILSSMAPTIAVDPQGTTLLVTGASGGPRIITAVFQVISNVVDYDFDIASAVSAPRIHHQHLPDFIRYEGGGFTAAQLAALKARGHALEETDHLGIAASILRRNGVLQGMADPRTQGGAEGY
jgi:gamma-glutamyltranspeptidase/glutathione hydrolase